MNKYEAMVIVKPDLADEDKKWDLASLWSSPTSTRVENMGVEKNLVRDKIVQLGIQYKIPRDQLQASTDADYNRNKLFKKGINLMADEKLEDAAHVFEQVLRIDPDNVDALLKLGYTRFHLDDHSDALKVYDKILDIDVTNSEAWNLKGLVHYEQKQNDAHCCGASHRCGGILLCRRTSRGRP